VNALAQARAIGEQYTGALLSQTLGEIRLQEGQVDEVVSLLADALDYYRRHQMRPHLSHALELLAAAYDRQGEQEKANQARAEWAQVVHQRDTQMKEVKP
jgi:predicted Zn-dependent protease